ncbi:MAG: AbrB/MazE/SpoVT family DNA-binding domain-containing protein [Candidatus Spechtbacterales bacterium]|nr:AbrB/MazE/SpoVT family DNA-binding domain-containing protein [Candidatus Spechtbacterales bacterium]
MREKNDPDKKPVRKITKIAGGDSYAVVIPIEFIRKLNWKERQKVTFELKGENIIIKDWKK